MCRNPLLSRNTTHQTRPRVPPATLPGPVTLAIDLGITIDRDNWIKTDEAQVELQGRLKARKPAGGPVDMVGTLHTVRGSVEYGW
jgi:TamB, inner membrane protein subunit of TAM complex